jgi:O-antigen/teichoic acid export membrane protein
VGNVFLALGKTGILLKGNPVAGIVEIGLLYPAIRCGGINTVAVLVTAVYAIQYLIYFPYLQKECEIKAREIISVLKLPVLCGFGIAVSAVVLGRETGFSVTSMLIKAFFCIIGYFTIYGLFTKWKMLKEGRAIFGELAWRTGQ